MTATKWIAALAAPVFLATAALAGTAGWSTDLDKSLAGAKADKKHVMVLLTGSDWCPPCIMMHKKVFSQKEFVAEASKNFELVELDFPRADKELSEKNEKLAKRYVQESELSFPSTLVLDADGKLITRFIASEFPDKDAFLKKLNDTLAKKNLD